MNNTHKVPQDDGWTSRKWALCVATFIAILVLSWVLRDKAAALQWAITGLLLLFGSYAGLNVMDARGKLGRLAADFKPVDNNKNLVDRKEMYHE